MTNTIIEDDSDDSINLLELLTTLGESKWLIAKITMVIAIITAAISLVLTPMYTAKTTFIVPTPSAGGSAAQALANLGGLMSGSGAASLLTGGKSPDEMYMEFLKSKRLVDSLIHQFDLQIRYKAKTLPAAEEALRNRTKVTSNKKAGLLSIEVDDFDPQFSAQLANAYIAGLKDMLKDFAVTEAQQRKKFYEEQLLRTKREMAGITDYRELKVRESVLAVLLNQYEVALLDTSREGVLQVTEEAVPPLKKSRPKRMLMVLIATMAGLFVSILWVFTRKALMNSQQDEQSASQWQSLKKAWHWRS